MLSVRTDIFKFTKEQHASAPSQQPNTQKGTDMPLASLFLYELARDSQAFEQLSRLAQRFRDESLENEVAPVCQISLALASKVDFYNFNHTNSLFTPTEVLKIIEDSKSQIQFEKIPVSRKFKRYIENQ